MLKVDLFPDHMHCIETVAKREHTAASKQLLEPWQRNKKLEEKLEILRLFLETANFKKLRSKSEKLLAEGKRVKFVVFLENGVSKHEIHVT